MSLLPFIRSEGAMIIYGSFVDSWSLRLEDEGNEFVYRSKSGLTPKVMQVYITYRQKPMPLLFEPLVTAFVGKLIF